MNLHLKNNKLFWHYGLQPETYPPVWWQWLWTVDSGMVREGGADMSAEWGEACRMRCPNLFVRWCVCRVPAIEWREVRRYGLRKEDAIHSLCFGPLCCMEAAGKTFNVFLAELRGLAVLFGSVSDQCLQCAFIAGLPDHAEELLQVSSQMKDLDLSHVLARASSILKNCTGATEQAAVAARLVQCTSKKMYAPLKCYKCNGPNYKVSDCLLGHETFRGASAKPWRTV